MKKLLHIVASPREDESRTLKVSGAFLEAFKEKHPDWVIDELNLFQYVGGKVEGLVKEKKMIVISSRGGDYSSEQMRAFDMQEPYLRTIFAFVGISDMIFIIAQPVDMGPELEKEKLEEARALARKIARDRQL